MSTADSSTKIQTITHKQKEGFIQKLRKFFGVKTSKEQMEEFLSEAVDIYDLESRMRQWEAKERANSMQLTNYWGKH